MGAHTALPDESEALSATVPAQGSLPAGRCLGHPQPLSVRPSGSPAREGTGHAGGCGVAVGPRGPRGLCRERTEFVPFLKPRCRGHSRPRRAPGESACPSAEQDGLGGRRPCSGMAAESSGRLRKAGPRGRGLCSWPRGTDPRGGQHSTLRKSYDPSFAFFLEYNINRKTKSTFLVKILKGKKPSELLLLVLLICVFCTVVQCRDFVQLLLAENPG